MKVTHPFARGSQLFITSLCCRWHFLHVRRQFIFRTTSQSSPTISTVLYFAHIFRCFQKMPQLIFYAWALYKAKIQKSIQLYTDVNIVIAPIYVNSSSISVSTNINLLFPKYCAYWNVNWAKILTLECQIQLSHLINLILSIFLFYLFQ